MSELLILFAIPLMAVINRLRGGGWWAIHLPGHPRWYTSAAAMVLAVLCLRTWQAGVLFGAGYAAWSLLPWGHLYSFGRWVPPRPASWLEVVLLRAAAGQYWLALLTLHAIGVLGLLPLVWWEFPGPEFPAMILMPFLIVAAYEVGWTFDESRAISRAELMTGALWGSFLVLTRL